MSTGTAPAVAPTAPAEPQCQLVTEVAELRTFLGDIPDDVTPDAAYNATLQFLITSGSTIEGQDPVARTIVTNRADGQTLLSTCAVNRYFMYAFHIAIVGRRMIVNMQCWTSMGWEAGVSRGVAVPRNRGELKACDVPAYVGKNDARMPSMIFDGAIGLIDLSRPATTPRWWCYNERFTCFRTRNECTTKPNVAAEDCKPRMRAYCSVGEPRACFGDLDVCKLGARDQERACSISGE